MTTDQDVMDSMYLGLQALEQRPGLTGLRAFLERFESAKIEAANLQRSDAANWHLNDAPDAKTTKTWGPIYAAILKDIIEKNPDSDDATNAQFILDEIKLYFLSDDSFDVTVQIRQNDQKLSRDVGMEKEFLRTLTDIGAAVAFCAKIHMLYLQNQEIQNLDSLTPEEKTWIALKAVARWPHMVAAGGSTTPDEFDAQVANVCQKFPYTSLLAGYS